MPYLLLGAWTVRVLVAPLEEALLDTFGGVGALSGIDFFEVATDLGTDVGVQTCRFSKRF